MNTLGRFQNVSLERKATKKLYRLFSTTPSFFVFQFPPLPALTLFFTCSTQQVLRRQQLFPSNCATHTRGFVKPVHWVTSRSTWFLSALPTCCLGSGIYWAGLRPRPAEPSCGQPSFSGAWEGESRRATEQAELRALQLLLMKWWQLRVWWATEWSFPWRVCLSFKELHEHSLCSWVVLFMSPKRQPLPICIIWLSLPIIPLAA